MSVANDELRPDEAESYTVLYLTRRCQLCGWRGLDPRLQHQRCGECGAWVGRP